MSAVPPLSVVLPVHNGMPYVEDCLRSLLAQTFGDFELVVGDDGSTDGTTEALRDWASRDERIRVARRERSSGLVSSSNWVVSLARAPLIARIDADDLADPDRFARQVKLLRARPEAAAAAVLARSIDARGRQVQPPPYWRLARPSLFAPFVHSTLMMRRRCFDRVGGYRPGADYWEDLDLYWRLMEIGPILVLPEVLASHRYSHVSTRSRDADARVEAALDLMYRSTALYRRGIDHGPLLAAGPAVDGRIHPRAFVARSWTALWCGRRPAMIGALLRRGRLRFDWPSMVSLAFVAAAEISPRLLCALVRGWTIARNLAARPRVAPHAAIEWCTRPTRTEGERRSG